MEKKYFPKSEEELYELVKIPDINFAEIDMSAIDDIYEQLFDGEYAENFNRLVNFDFPLTDRGWAFKKSFCECANLEQKNVRINNPKKIIDIKDLKEITFETGCKEDVGFIYCAKALYEDDLDDFEEALSAAIEDNEISALEDYIIDNGEDLEIDLASGDQVLKFSTNCEIFDGKKAVCAFGNGVMVKPSEKELKEFSKNSLDGACGHIVLCEELSFANYEIDLNELKQKSNGQIQIDKFFFLRSDHSKVTEKHCAVASDEDIRGWNWTNKILYVPDLKAALIESLGESKGLAEFEKACANAGNNEPSVLDLDDANVLKIEDDKSYVISVEKVSDDGAGMAAWVFDKNKTLIYRQGSMFGWNAGINVNGDCDEKEDVDEIMQALRDE